MANGALEMEEANVLDLLPDMVFHLETRTNEQLRKLTFNGMPALHYLATFPCQPNEGIMQFLDQTIKLFKNAGCDLNEKTYDYISEQTRSGCLGFTPLLVAIDQHNLAFVECLLQNGARVDVSDNEGFPPLHWAVFVDDMDCLRVLIQAGALQALPNQKSSAEVHPILHTAVDERRTEMVTYLLENGLVDPNQEADYTTSVRREGRHRSALQQTSMRFTPLARAIRPWRQPIVETLLKHGAKVSGFNELHYCILQGEVEVACMLLDQFSPQDLANNKIDDKWALLCLNESVIFWESDELSENTIQLINAYVEAGWDLNSVGKLTTSIKNIGNFTVDHSTNFSLLHLACYFRSRELIKHLVKVGADVNSTTCGSAILNPLQISILREDWSSIEYLMANGADIHAVGGFKTVENRKWISIPNSRDIDLECHFTSIDLLLQVGWMEGLPTLEQMLKKGVPPPEKIALQRAILGGNFEFIVKVVERLCGVQKVKIEDLTWLPVRNDTGEIECMPLHWFILDRIDNTCKLFDLHDNNRWEFDETPDIRTPLSKVVDVMGRFGYDFTLGGRLENGNNQRILKKPLIFSVLRIEEPHSDLPTIGLPLLETFLKFDLVRLNVHDVTYGHGRRNPVEVVIQNWKIRWASDIRRKTDAVCLLIRSGVDMSGSTIGDGFQINYYRGYLPMMQLLCCTGATIKPDRFVPSVAKDEKEVLATGIVNREIEELKKWNKETFDRTHKFTLKYLCVLKIREGLETTGDLRRLYRKSVELESVMDDVMVQFMNSDC